MLSFLLSVISITAAGLCRSYK